MNLILHGMGIGDMYFDISFSPVDAVTPLFDIESNHHNPLAGYKP